jgi:hypothetical protein
LAPQVCKVLIVNVKDHGFLLVNARGEYTPDMGPDGFDVFLSYARSDVAAAA